jgi:chromosome partitioning protein
MRAGVSLRSCAVAPKRNRATVSPRIRAAAPVRVFAAVRLLIGTGAQMRNCADGGWGVSAVIAVLNRKGGAGKTSVTKDLGHALAERGVRVLQVGLDPQSSLEVLAGLGFDTPPDRTVTRLLMPEEFRGLGELDTVVHDTPWRTQLVPASKALATAERALGEVGRGGATQRLKRGLEQLGAVEHWDVVLIDCPPGMTALTMNALVAAGSVLVPTQLDFLSVAGLAVLMQTVDEVREYDNPALRYLGIVGTQADERTRHARDVREQLEQMFGERAGGTLCRTTIRLSTRVREAHLAREAVGQAFPEHPVSQDYRDLADELIVRARLSASLEAPR